MPHLKRKITMIYCTKINSAQMKVSWDIVKIRVKGKHFSEYCDFLYMIQSREQTK